MPKYHWIQFHFIDFEKDTELLSNKATGGWVRILCHMWHKQKGCLTKNIKKWAKVMRCGTAEAEEIFNELIEENICGMSRDSNGEITVMSRRINRDVTKRNTEKEQARIRQQKFREKTQNRNPNPQEITEAATAQPDGLKGLSRVNNAKSNAICNANVTEKVTIPPLNNPPPDKSKVKSQESHTPLTPLKGEMCDNTVTTETFEKEFWPVYPERNGKKLKKNKALEQFLKIPKRDIPLVLQAVKNYAESRDVKNGIGILDAFRWLRDRSYKDWVEKEILQNHKSGEKDDVVTNMQKEKWIDWVNNEESDDG